MCFCAVNGTHTKRARLEAVILFHRGSAGAGEEGPNSSQARSACMHACIACICMYIRPARFACIYGIHSMYMCVYNSRMYEHAYGHSHQDLHVNVRVLHVYVCATSQVNSARVCAYITHICACITCMRVYACVYNMHICLYSAQITVSGSYVCVYRMCMRVYMRVRRLLPPQNIIL